MNRAAYYTQKQKCRRSSIRPVLALLLLIAMALVCVDFLPFEARDTLPPPATKPESWSLILVNPWHSIPADWQVELTTLSNGQAVDSRIYPDLQEMFDTARAEGIYPTVVAGYRTQEKQQSLMDEKIAAYIAEGYPKSEAEAAAKTWVAVPGTSEHQLGLAVDINADIANSTDEAVYQWLAAHAWEFGFILRYPQDKVETTGTNYEPWHYRYVGKDAAAQIHASGQCLEEYLDCVTS